MTRKVAVGAIAGAFGVQGEVRLKSFCADPAAIVDYVPLTTEDGSREFAQIVLTGQTKNALVARVGGIVTKEDADALRGTVLFANRSAMPEPEDDEYYHADLIGLSVFDTGGTEIGRVHNVIETGGGDLLEVLIPGQSETVLFPFTMAVVPTVDIAGGRIVADPPDGLLPE